MHLMPTTISTSTNRNQNTYPSANAVLLENDIDNSGCTSAAVASTAAAKQPSFRDQYATAHVVGEDVSPFSTRLVHATETHATAIALDPWSMQKTVATETEEQHRDANERPIFVYQPPSSDYTSPNDVASNANANYGTGILPAAALENPIRKKYRRRVRRRGRMVAGGAVGFVVGSIFLGPIGAIALAIGSASAIRSASKGRERRKDRRVQRQIEQLQRQREQGELERIVIVRR